MRCRVGTVRVLIADVIRGQRWAPPGLALLALLGVLYAADAGPPREAFAPTVVGLFAVATWCTAAELRAGSTDLGDVYAAAMGGHGPLHRARITITAVVQIPLAAVCVAWPAAASARPLSAEILLEGAAAHLTALATGVALGVLLAPPLLPRLAWAVSAGVAAVLLAIVVPAATPIGWVVRALYRPPPPPATSAAIAGVALLLAVAAGTGCAVLAGRRR